MLKKLLNKFNRHVFNFHKIILLQFKKFFHIKLLYNNALDLAFNNKLSEAKKIYQLAYNNNSNYIKNSRSDYKPKYIQIETVRVCNAACIMCTISTSPSLNQSMTDAIFERIIEEIKSYKNYDPYISLLGLNEPLMDKKIFKRIKKIKESGISMISIQSNGSLLNEEKSEKLLESGICAIGFSIESINKDVFEKIRLKLELEKVLSGIKTFIKIRNKIKPKLPISIFYTYSEKNLNEYNQYRSYWKNELTIGVDHIFLAPIHSFNKFEMYSEINDQLPCYQIFNDMHIRADGEVSMCCIDVESEYGYGNIKEKSIEEIYNCKLIKEDRHKHLIGERKKIKICNNCDQPESIANFCMDKLDENIPVLKNRYFKIQTNQASILLNE